MTKRTEHPQATPLHCFQSYGVQRCILWDGSIYRAIWRPVDSGLAVRQMVLQAVEWCKVRRKEAGGPGGPGRPSEGSFWSGVAVGIEGGVWAQGADLLMEAERGFCPGGFPAGEYLGLVKLPCKVVAMASVSRGRTPGPGAAAGLGTRGRTCCSHLARVFPILPDHRGTPSN